MHVRQENGIHERAPADLLAGIHRLFDRGHVASHHDQVVARLDRAALDRLNGSPLDHGITRLDAYGDAVEFKKR